MHASSSVTEGADAVFVLTIDADATATLRVAVAVTEDGDMIDSPAPTIVTIQGRREHRDVLRSHG